MLRNANQALAETNVQRRRNGQSKRLATQKWVDTYVDKKIAEAIANCKHYTEVIRIPDEVNQATVYHYLQSANYHLKPVNKSGSKIVVYWGANVPIMTKESGES